MQPARQFFKAGLHNFSLSLNLRPPVRVDAAPACCEGDAVWPIAMQLSALNYEAICEAT
jgi:hypothetical protein